MTRSQRYTALHRRVVFSARVVLVLPAVAGAALMTGAGGVAVVEADAAGVSPAILAADDGAPLGAGAPGLESGEEPPAAPASGPVAGECEEDAAQATAGAEDGVEPSYEPGAPVRLTGSGWCAGGRLLQGEQTVRVRLVAVGGYASPEEALVPATFVDGAFDTSVQVGELYTLSGQGPGGYYLSVTVDSRVYVGTARFQIAEPAPQPASASEPVDDVEPSAEPAPEQTPEAVSGPASEPNDALAPQPADRPSAEPAPASEPVDDVEPSAEPAPEPTPEPTPVPEPSEAPASPAPTSDAPSEPATSPEPPPSEPTPVGLPDATPQPDGGGPRDDRSAPPDSQDAPGGPSGAPGTAPAPEPEAEPTTTPEAGKERPTTRPAAPVNDASKLDASNAGSLSGTRRGNIVSLILPSDKAKKDDWVAVFLFPQESTPGWMQVDADNSVSIDVSSLPAGTYQLAVGDRDSRLLGWAQLEITTAAADTSEPARMTVATAAVPQPTALGRDDWMLVSAGGLLLVGAASFLILAGPALTGRRR